MKLGIIGAMREEIETLLAAMADRSEEEHAGSVYYSGSLRGLPVVAVQCGVGKVNAALSAQILCDCYGVTHLVNTGIAGSLNPALDIGDLVVSTDAIYHDFDCTAFGYSPCRVPGMRLAKPIYNRNGVMLYERNSKITSQGIISVNNCRYFAI